MDNINYLKECRLLGLIDRKHGSSILCTNRDFSNLENPINKLPFVCVDICFDNNQHKGNPLYVVVIGNISDFKTEVTNKLCQQK